jgi:hypothetical protein
MVLGGRILQMIEKAAKIFFSSVSPATAGVRIPSGTITDA